MCLIYASMYWGSPTHSGTKVSTRVKQSGHVWKITISKGLKELSIRIECLAGRGRAPPCRKRILSIDSRRYKNIRFCSFVRLFLFLIKKDRRKCLRGGGEYAVWYILRDLEAFSSSTGSSFSLYRAYIIRSPLILHVPMVVIRRGRMFFELSLYDTRTSINSPLRALSMSVRATAIDRRFYRDTTETLSPGH